MVLATLQDGTMGKWKEAQVAYSYPLEHKVRYVMYEIKVMHPFQQMSRIYGISATREEVANVHSNFVRYDRALR